jgi:hypothetical protein
MKMAKASEGDISMSMELCGALESLCSCYCQMKLQRLKWP